MGGRDEKKATGRRACAQNRVCDSHYLSSIYRCVFIIIFIIGSDQKRSKKDDIVRRPRNIDIQIRQAKVENNNKERTKERGSAQCQAATPPLFIIQNATPSLSKTPAMA